MGHGGDGAFARFYGRPMLHEYITGSSNRMDIRLAPGRHKNVRLAVDSVAGQGDYGLWLLPLINACCLKEGAGFWDSGMQRASSSAERAEFNHVHQAS